MDYLYLATAYGDGVYFARDASYSAQDAYSSPNQYKHKFIYVANVLIGEFTQGQQGIRVAPSKPGSNNNAELYDSVVDNKQNPQIFVIFKDDGAYPEYLIEFA